MKAVVRKFRVLAVVERPAHPNSSLRSIPIPTIRERCFGSRAHHLWVGFESGYHLRHVQLQEVYADWLSHWTCISAVSFDPISRLRHIRRCAFSGSSLISIRIPSRVDTIGPECFRDCQGHCSLRISRILHCSTWKVMHFVECHALQTVWIPACLERIVVRLFGRTPSVNVAVIETGSIRLIPDRSMLNVLDDSDDGGGFGEGARKVNPADPDGGLFSPGYGARNLLYSTMCSFPRASRFTK
jgi:hypothetical protein